MERTLILAKPDAVQRGLVGEIVKRFEQRGFRIVGMKMINPSESHLGMHYADDPVWKKSVGAKNRASMESKGVKVTETDEEIGARIRRWNMECLQAPLIAMVFEGESVVEAGRKIVGATEPKSAAPGTIRGDYSNDSYALSDKQKRVLRNLMHASGDPKEAEREIKVWFTDKELYDYAKHDTKLIYG